MNRVVDLLRAHPGMAGVQVELGHPGDELKAEAVWITLVAGEQSIPVMKAGRKERDDRFRIPLFIRVANRATFESTGERLIELMAVVDDQFAGDTELGGLDGVVSATLEGEMTGPWVERTTEGCVGWAEPSIDVHARLT